MAIKADGMIMDKCSMGGFFQKRADGTVALGEAGVVMDGVYVPAAFTLGFTGSPRLYKYVFFDNMVKGGVYEITGSAAPVGTEVFLSVVQGENDLVRNLEENHPVASVASNGENGVFSFTEITHDGSGRYIVWTRLALDYTTATSAALSAKATRSNEATGSIQSVMLDITDATGCSTCGGTGVRGCETHGQECQTTVCEDCDGTGYADGVICPNCGGMGWLCAECVAEGGAGTLIGACSACGGTGVTASAQWSGTISGQCPADAAAVYLSSGGSLEMTDLEAAVVSSAIPTINEDGSTSYSIDATVTTNQYVVWCVSETEGILTAAMNGSYGDNNPCLSGDTLITMADGSVKRLDKLEVGDMILAGDGVPTEVTKTDRGVWQPFHTLYHFEDGTVIDEIADHRFYNVEQGFWQKLNRWNIGEHAKRQDGTEIALVKVERIDEEAECFGLWTESDDHFANGLLGGGAGANRPLLADATLEQAADMAISLSELEIEKMFYGGVL